MVLAGAIQDFYNFLTAPWTVSNIYTHVAKAKSCANHMQHIRHKSSHRVSLPITNQPIWNRFKAYHFKILQDNMESLLTEL